MAKSAQIARLQRRLEAIPEAVRRDVQPALVKQAERLADQMRRLAPVAEGDLRDSIKVTPPGQATPAYSQPGGQRVAGELEALVTVGDHDVRYGHLVEYGTARAPAQGFFWNSVRLLQKSINTGIRRTIGKAFKGQGQGGS